MSLTGSAAEAGSAHRRAFSDAGYKPYLIPIPPSEHDPLLTNLEIYALRYEKKSTSSPSSSSSTKEPLLLIHGHPQNLAIWHRIAPALAQRADRDIVIVDMRGHGHSGVPRVRNFIRRGHKIQEGTSAVTTVAAVSASQTEEVPDGEALKRRYSKREVGRDFVHVMTKHFGYVHFAVVGHDRGGRVAHRMAVDYKDVITRVMVLDIVPTLDLYEKGDSQFASAYWHWYFLIQPYPTPEEMIVHAPKSYLNALTTRFLQGNTSADVFPDDVFATYLSQLSSMPRVHAMCEDYRCSAPGGVDLEEDKRDREAGIKITQPLHAIWGAKGMNETLFGTEGCLALWQNVCAQRISGRPLDCGHYMPEEAPEAVLEEMLNFFA